MKPSEPLHLRRNRDRGVAGRAALLAVAVLLAPACNAQKGLRVDVDMGSMFKSSVKTLDVRIHVNNGFKSGNSDPVQRRRHAHL
jgi:hypothetical protein